MVEGLEDFAREELQSRFAGRVSFVKGKDEPQLSGAVRFHYTGSLRALFSVRSVASIYLVQRFPVPRPRALLGHEHFHTIVKQIEYVRDLHPAAVFRTIHLDAAGSHTKVMTRLISELANVSGLALDDSAGDLQLRVRRPPDGGDGWEALIRLTPRPLSTRNWRVCNYEGALNASVAHIMALLTEPKASDVFLNLASGSGSILIERAGWGPARHIVGCDNNRHALNCAAANIAASNCSNRIRLNEGDLRALPYANHAGDALCADLPFGQRVGSHEDNRALYPHCLREAARVAKPGARFVLLTHEIRLLEPLLRSTNDWKTENVLKITLRGLHPRIYVLTRL